MAEYRSRYYSVKQYITEQNILIEDSLKIRMLNNLGQAFKTYLTIVNTGMRKNRKLDDDEKLFKAIAEKKTRIVAE